jgi:hypothetical protein
MLNTQLPLVWKLRMDPDIHSNLTICLLGAERNNFTLLLSILTNIGNYYSKEKVSYKKTLNVMVNGDLLWKTQWNFWFHKIFFAIIGTINFS